MYTHSNSCVYARSHECVSRRVMFERIQTVLLKKWYTKQTLTLIFWQTLAIILKKCRKVTHTFSAWFPTSKIGLQNILSKGDHPCGFWVMCPSAARLWLVQTSINQSKLQMHWVCPTISTHPLNQCCKHYHSCWRLHTHIIETRCSLCSWDVSFCPKYSSVLRDTVMRVSCSKWGHHTHAEALFRLQSAWLLVFRNNQVFISTSLSEAGNHDFWCLLWLLALVRLFMIWCHWDFR